MKGGSLEALVRVNGRDRFRTLKMAGFSDRQVRFTFTLSFWFLATSPNTLVFPPLFMFRLLGTAVCHRE
jgi:hypothetical protein